MILLNFTYRSTFYFQNYQELASELIIKSLNNFLAAMANSVIASAMWPWLTAIILMNGSRSRINQKLIFAIMH